jgi:hypothetical protein
MPIVKLGERSVVNRKRCGRRHHRWRGASYGDGMLGNPGIRTAVAGIAMAAKKMMGVR